MVAPINNLVSTSQNNQKCQSTMETTVVTPVPSLEAPPVAAPVIDTITPTDKAQGNCDNKNTSNQFIINLPMGLSPSPDLLQRFMNNIFSDLLDVHVIVYADKIRVFSDNPNNLCFYVCEVLHRLHAHGFYTPVRATCKLRGEILYMKRAQFFDD